MAPAAVTDLADELGRISADLRTLDRGFAVVGGLAVSTRAEPRLTRDVDVAVAVASDREAEDVVLQLQQTGYRVLAAVERVETGRLATVRLIVERGAGRQRDLLGLLHQLRDAGAF